MALESNARKLLAWNEEIHKMLRNSSPQPEQQEAIKKAIEQLPTKRVDLILSNNPPDIEWSFAGLIEFKRFNPKEDRDKLLNLLCRLDNCSAGAICCLTNTHCHDEFVQGQKWEARPQEIASSATM
jgi:hypothetical protein